MPDHFHLLEVPVPPGLDRAQAEAFIARMAHAYEAADPMSMAARTNANYQPDLAAGDVQPIDATATMQPLYFCHGKF